MSDIYQRKDHFSYEILSAEDRVAIANRETPIRFEERIELTLLEHGVSPSNVESATDDLELIVKREAALAAAKLFAEMVKRIPGREAKALLHALDINENSLREDARNSGISAPGFLKLIRRLKDAVNTSP